MAPKLDKLAREVSCRNLVQSWLFHMTCKVYHVTKPSNFWLKLLWTIPNFLLVSDFVFPFLVTDQIIKIIMKLLFVYYKIQLVLFSFLYLISFVSHATQANPGSTSFNQEPSSFFNNFLVPLLNFSVSFMNLCYIIFEMKKQNQKHYTTKGRQKLKMESINY